MMASNLLSRLLPSADDNSVYEPLDRHQRRIRTVDVEDHAGLALDEENLEARFQETDLEHLLAEAADSQMTTQSAAFLQGDNNHGRTGQPSSTPQNRPRWMRSAPKHPVAGGGDEDDDVPASLLLDSNREPAAARSGENSSRPVDLRPGRLPSPVPGPSTRNARAQWNTARAQQRLHDDDFRTSQPRRQPRLRPGVNGIVFTDKREEAMWMWANVHNLDAFLADVYNYFEGHGIWSIILNKYLNLLKSACIVGTCTMLLYCIEYKNIQTAHHLKEIFKGREALQDIHGFYFFGLWCFCVAWFYGFIQATVGIRSLWRMHNFYHYLLDIPDSDIQTASWQLVVSRLMALRDANLTTAENISVQARRELGAHQKERMDAHDIANRVMRKENYQIALFNKDILNLTLPLPFLGNAQFYSRTMELLFNTCVTQFVFTKDGHVRREFLASKERQQLINKLNQRFKKAAALSIIVAPLSVVFFVVLYFFRYFSEYRKDPSQLGSRMFTPMAEWKFREFNELQHLFERRRNMAYPYAERYLQQFPKKKMDQLFEFTSFIVGTCIAVLAMGSLLYPEVLVGLEITPGQTVLFWLGVLTTVYAVARNSISGQEIVLDPEYALEQVIHCTHYCPASWRDRLHTDEVRKEFSKLYQMKIVVFLEELLSMVCTPLVLWFSLPTSSARIVDFFREFTVHVDGLGHVCSFAVFDFKKTADNIAKQGQQTKGDDDLRHDYFAAKDGKLDASMIGFMQAYGATGRRGMYRENFNLPPEFPPLPGVDVGPLVSARDAPSRRAMQRTPRSGPAAGSPSPMQSVLLDPRHQPSFVGTRNSPRNAAQARYRPNRHLINSNPDELEEEPQAETGNMRQAVFPGQSAEDDSNLGESWLHNASSGNADNDELEAADGAQGAGVLGLLSQFQRAQAHGRGPGV